MTNTAKQMLMKNVGQISPYKSHEEPQGGISVAVFLF